MAQLGHKRNKSELVRWKTAAEAEEEQPLKKCKRSWQRASSTELRRKPDQLKRDEVASTRIRN